MIALIACLALLVAPAFASYGVNLHGPVTVDNLKCLQNASFNYINFPLTDLTNANGTNANISYTIANALVAGIGMIDGTIDLCPKTQPDVTKYMNAVLQSTQSVDRDIVKHFLLDVENQPGHDSGKETCWSDNTTANVEYIRAAADALSDRYIPSGVYTNQENWTAITGGDFNGEYIGVLGWAHLDTPATMADFKPFGGWTVPAEKHFKSGRLCGIRISYVYGEGYFCAREGAVCGANLMDCCPYVGNLKCDGGFCKRQ